MKIMNANCPNCGAALEFDENDSQTVCEYCDSVIILDNENKSKEYEDAGYSFEMGRQKAREELNGRYIPQQNTYQNEEPKKRKTWLWVLGWMFMFPIPLSIIVGRSKKIPTWLKAVIIIAVWAVYFFWLATAENEDAQSAETAQDSVTTSYSQAAYE